MRVRAVKLSCSMSCGATDDANRVTTHQAVLKIVKHCKEHLPQLVTGQLLGLDYDTTLEVTNCFPFPSRSEANDDFEDQDGSVDYQYDMMRALRWDCHVRHLVRLILTSRDVNVDNNTVGWYHSTYLGSHITEELISTQFNYQVIDSRTVCFTLRSDVTLAIAGKHPKMCLPNLRSPQDSTG